MFPKQHRFWRIIATLLTALIAAVFGSSNSTQALSEQTQVSLGQTIDDRIARIREEFSDIEEATSVELGNLEPEDNGAKHYTIVAQAWNNWSNASPSPSPAPARSGRRQ